MNDLISVIIPVYNTQRYLKECILSVLNQTYKNIEIILINDGSTDNSQSIIESFMKKYKNIILISNENQGVFISRLLGLKEAKGKYIMFLDSDDYIKKDAISILYERIKKDKVDLVRCNLLEFDDQKVYYDNNDIVEGIYNKDEFDKYVYSLLFSGIYFNSLCRQLIKKDVLLKSYIKPKTNLKYAEDLFVQFNVLMNVKSIALINDRLLMYRNNDLSVTKIKKTDAYIKSILDNCYVINYIYNNFYKYNISKENYKEILYARLFNDIIRTFLKLVDVNSKYNAFILNLNQIYSSGEFSDALNQIKSNNYYLNHKIYNFVIYLLKKHKISLLYLIFTFMNSIKRK